MGNENVYEMNILIKSLNYIWLHLWKYKAVERQHVKYVNTLCGKKPVRVVFMAIDVALWRYQHVYELMAQDSRFQPFIVLSPCIGRDMEKDMNSLRQYFRKHGIEYIDYKGTPVDIRKELKPDIIFYTQPYEYLLEDEYDCRHFYDLLLCYMPYGLWMSTGKLSYNLHFHNQAWRLYYTNALHLKEAQKVADNHGRNVRVVGYANADDYLRPKHDSAVWKTPADGKPRKRIIWAPHFSVIKETSALPPRSNFLWMAQLMLDIAKEYADRIQIAFKPHPSLLTQLYQVKDWGRWRADEYYAQWQQMENTQLETGEFTDLFMTSDAMIHDSGSFAAEYHYSQNPVMFVSKDMRPIYATLSEFGKQAHDMHYIGTDEADIRWFINEVVLNGDDPMRPKRRQFYEDYLLPPNQNSVAQNIVNDIVESLQL